MRKVLITGLNSYIGNSFEAYCENSQEITCSKVSLKDENWKKTSWEQFDSVLHVAGLAHVDVRHADEETRSRYYKINRDLTLKAAEKAKKDGVGQFLYLSSIIVYGDSAGIGEDGCITERTQTSPANFYGDSKLQAELELLKLADEDFKVVIIRTPMVYGKNSKGNFPLLLKLSKTTPIFPKIDNKRGMIYIKNLCELVRQIIMQNRKGLFYPQNRELISTSQLVYMLAREQGKKVWLVPGTTWIWKVLSPMTGYVNKIFGNLYYEQSLADNSGLEYCIYSLEESLKEMVERI